MLWIGMNPSTAEADVDDPTIRREIAFTKREGFEGYAKCNVMDYRATDPKRLLDEDVAPTSRDNLHFIANYAQAASKIVVCWGKLPKKLKRYARRVTHMLREEGHTLMCLGCNSDGSPKHPLYVHSDLSLLPWYGDQ
jgi:hypothetical protein